MIQHDRFDLERFVHAQEPVFETVRAELRAGKKATHWMWFIFPQMAGLGSSARAVRYAISGADEARAYLGHPVLGSRLMECAEAALAIQGRTASEIFGPTDELKLRSSMTLFASVADPGSVFERVLRKYFAGEVDAQTIARLADGQGTGAMG